MSRKDWPKFSICCILDLAFTVKAKLKTTERSGLTVLFLRASWIMLSYPVVQDKPGSLLSLFTHKSTAGA